MDNEWNVPTFWSKPATRIEEAADSFLAHVGPGVWLFNDTYRGYVDWATRRELPVASEHLWRNALVDRGVALYTLNRRRVAEVL